MYCHISTKWLEIAMRQAKKSTRHGLKRRAVRSVVTESRYGWDKVTIMSWNGDKTRWASGKDKGGRFCLLLSKSCTYLLCINVYRTRATGLKSPLYPALTAVDRPSKGSEWTPEGILAIWWTDGSEVFTNWCVRQPRPPWNSCMAELLYWFLGLLFEERLLISPS